MKCSDIPDRPILEYLAGLPDGGGIGTTHWPGWDQTLASVMPPELPDKLRLAKMRVLYRRGLVDGCPCGCRGDWEITPRGREYLARQLQVAS